MYVDNEIAINIISDHDERQIDHKPHSLWPSLETGNVNSSNHIEYIYIHAHAHRHCS